MPSPFGGLFFFVWLLMVSGSIISGIIALIALWRAMKAHESIAISMVGISRVLLNEAYKLNVTDSRKQQSEPIRDLISFKCPICGEINSADRKYIGKKIICTECTEDIIVPAGIDE